MGSVGSPSFNHPVNVPVLSSQRAKISVSLSEALEKATFGKYQRRLMVLTGLASAGDAMEALLLSFLVDEIRQDMEIDNGFIGAAMFVGVLLGNLASGVVSDSLGRWVGFFSSTILIAVFGLLSAFSPTAYWLCILRFFVGVGLGGGHVAFTLFTEFLPARNRGKILLVNQLFWSGGAIFQVLIAWYVLPRYGWRILLILSSLPVFIIAFMAFDSPESPRFLIMKYRLKEAHSLLNSVSRTNNGTLHLENWEISDNGAKVADSVRENVKSLVVHFSATTMRLWLLWFSSSLVYYGIILASPRFFSTKNKYRDILISSVAEFPGFLVPLFFIDRFGRKRTLGVLYMITSVFCGLLSWGFSEAVSVICTFIVRGSVSAAFISLYVTTAESYPTSLRSSGFGLASCFARIAGVFTSFVSEDGSITLATGVFSMFGFFAAIAALTLPRETANQNLPSDGCDLLPYQRTLESDYEDLTVHSRESSLSIEEKLSPLIF